MLPSWGWHPLNLIKTGFQLENFLRMGFTSQVMGNIHPFLAL